MVGRSFLGGSSFSETLTGITAGGVAGLVIRLILLIFKIILGIRMLIFSGVVTILLGKILLQNKQ